MLSIYGNVARSYLFPANLDTAYDFYCDINRIFHYLPHISIVNQYPQHRYRMLYHTTELGVYRVNIYCDLVVEIDKTHSHILIHPAEPTGATMKGEVGLYSLVSHGEYTSSSTFVSQGDQTRIDYQFSLKAELPVPLGLRLVPNSVLDSIASSLAKWRIDEIAEGFINRSLEAFANR
jgi:hypothetical protein